MRLDGRIELRRGLAPLGEVVLDRITKVFPGGVTALTDLSLTVAKGECLTLVGPSGCGKTTLLRLVAGLETPTSGIVALRGRPVADVPPHRRGAAYLAQRPALYPHWTVDRNLRFGSPASPDAGSLERVVGLLGLGDLLATTIVFR